MRRGLLPWMRVAVVGALLAASPACSRIPWTADASDRAARQVSAKVVAAQNAFAFDLLAQLVKRGSGRNVFASPVSIDLALTMTANGAAGGTQRDMLKALHLSGIGIDEANRSNQALLAALQSSSSGITLSIADAIWADKRVRFAAPFVKSARALYAADARTLDLRAPGAANSINAWASDKTARKVDRIVEPVDLAQSDAVLTNAVYFRGTWTYRFDKAKTRSGEFTTLDGRRKTLPMMVQSGRFPYTQGAGFQATVLPYSGGKLSMLIVLPSPDSSLAALLKGLDQRTWDQWTTALHETRIDALVLPRFKIDVAAELNQPLTKLGMGRAFAPAADFRPMGLAGDFIGKVKHRAVLEVNEEGTEAAAATAVVMTKAIHRMGVTFVVNRPFLCAIRNNRTKAILFLGTIIDPA